MKRDVHSVLASFDDFEVHGQLHDVPPHAVYEVSVDGQRAVCKVARSSEAPIRREAAVLRFVDRETALPAPTVLDAGPDHFVAEWLDGLPEPGESPDPAHLTAGYARSLGAAMARLHAETIDAFERYGVPAPAGTGEDRDEPAPAGLAVDGHADWPDAICAFLERRLAYLEPVGWADSCRTVLDFAREHPDIFAPAGEPVLCHGNLLPDHVGFDGGDPAGMIDFEHALVAPGEYDVWRTALPLFFSPGSDAPDSAFAAFREGYESIRPLPDGFERRRDAYLLVNTASYFRALHVQNDGIGLEERKQVEGMAEWIDETLADLRAGVE